MWNLTTFWTPKNVLLVKTEVELQKRRDRGGGSQQIFALGFGP